MLRVMFFIVMLSVNRLIGQCKDGCLHGATTFRTMTFNLTTLSIAIKTCHSASKCKMLSVIFIGILNVIKFIVQCNDGCLYGTKTFRTMTLNLMAHNFTIKNRALSMKMQDAESHVFYCNAECQ
jgi:hypothetical protein